LYAINTKCIYSTAYNCCFLHTYDVSRKTGNTYRITTPPEQDRATAYNTHKIVEDRTYSFKDMLADKHKNRSLSQYSASTANDFIISSSNVNQPTAFQQMCITFKVHVQNVLRLNKPVAPFTDCSVNHSLIKTVLLLLDARCRSSSSRALPVAAAHTWNSLPEHTVSASTLQSFKRHLKTFLLQQSFRLAL